MNRNAYRFASFTLCLGALIFSAHGQEDAAAARDRIAQERSQLIDLNFPGGSAADYVAAVSRAAGGINVFVAPEAKEMPMPALQLSRVAVTSALAVLHDFAGTTSGGRPVRLQFSEGAGFLDGEQPIHSITAFMSIQQARPGIISHSTHSVWSVAEILNMDVKAEDMLSAIEASLDLIGKPPEVPAVQMRFHEATGILIARGTGEQLSAIGEVVESVRRSAQAQRATGQSQQHMGQLQQRLADVHNENQTLKQQLAKTQAQIQELRQRLEGRAP